MQTPGRDRSERIPFNDLPKEEQIRLLFAKAKYLTVLFRKNVVVILFQLDDYFVDIYKSKKTGQVLNARAYRSPKRLYKYQLDYLTFGKSLVRIEFLEM